MPRPTPPPSSTGLRRTGERRRAPVLVFLTQQPKLLIPVVSVVLLIVGLALQPVYGAVCLGLLMLLVGWLSYLSWPAVVGPARAVRLTTLVLLGVVLVQRVAF
jgi:hypothetical protein